jgi:serine/threonine-protein kinase
MGKYTTDALLGVGGMAAVYSATHRNGNRVALKVLHPELSRTADIKARFLREAYAANKVGHRGVVRVLDDECDPEGLAFLVMELLEGETLEQRRKRAGDKLEAIEAATIAASLLDVLAVAHERGVVHRDVKPDNVFLTADGELKLMDFGIARLLDGSGATRSGALMGTPAFMSPEQAGGRVKEVDGRSDVWSVGAVLFLLLTGHEVHAARSDHEQMIYAATQNARPVKSVAPEISEDLAQIVDVALAFDRDARWQTASAMGNALCAAAGITPNETIARPAGTEKAPALGKATLVMGSGDHEQES